MVNDASHFQKVSNIRVWGREIGEREDLMILSNVIKETISNLLMNTFKKEAIVTTQICGPKSGPDSDP